MEIRRIEPDLIPPAVASERGTRTDADQHRHDPPMREKGKHREPSDEEEQTAPQDEEILDIVTYDPDGLLQDSTHAENEMHNIDFRA